MGDNYGPIVVTRELVDPEWLRDKRIAIPGEMTSAFLALDPWYDVMPFDRTSWRPSRRARPRRAC